MFISDQGSKTSAASKTFRHRDRERGQVLPIVAISLVVLFGMTVLGVDVGHIASVANDVQTTADSAATAGANALVDALAAEAGESAATSIAQSEGRKIGRLNKVDGAVVAPEDIEIVAGSYDPTANTFSANTTPLNAVRATVTRNVPNIVAGIWPGSETSTVVKVATAGLRGVSQLGATDLPFMIGDCYYEAPNDCGNPPTLSLAPDGQRDTGWTNWSSVDDPHDTVDVYGWLPSECCAAPMGGNAGFCGRDWALPQPWTTLQLPLKVDDIVMMSDKEQKQSSFILADCIFNHDRDTFRIPLVECINTDTKHPATITGFATIKITHWDQKRWDIAFVCDAGNVGPPGGGDFGTGMVVLLD